MVPETIVRRSHKAPTKHKGDPPGLYISVANHAPQPTSRLLPGPGAPSRVRVTVWPEPSPLQPPGQFLGSVARASVVRHQPHRLIGRAHHLAQYLLAACQVADLTSLTSQGAGAP